jgi:hypothetical protein
LIYSLISYYKKDKTKWLNADNQNLIELQEENKKEIINFSNWKLLLKENKKTRKQENKKIKNSKVLRRY